MKPCPDTFPFPLVALDETASTNQYLSQLARARIRCRTDDRDCRVPNRR